MKKFILSTMLGMMALGVMAQENTVSFSYANDDVFAYGTSSAQRYDVAMCLQNAGLKGAAIKSIEAYVTSPENLGTCSVWLAKELALDGREIVTDLQEEVTPVAATYSTTEAGLLKLDLETPYEYDGESLYIGYSIDVPALTTDDQKKPVLLSAGENTNGFYLHGSRNPLIWTNYSARVGGVAVINVILEGDFPENALAVSSVDYVLAIAGTPVNVTANVVNMGASTVENIDVTYTLNDETFEKTVELDNPIEPNMAATVPVTFAIDPIDEKGLYIFTLDITALNGESNMSSNSKGENQIGVLDQPFTNRPLVEEYTGLWCGWCPRGFQGMEELGQVFGDDVVIICYHSDDPMMVANTPPAVMGYPEAQINQYAVIDPYYGTKNGSDFYIKTDVEQALQEEAICDINLVDYEIDGNMLTVTTSTIFGFPNDNANYSIGYVLTANGMSNPNWGQVNYFPMYANDYKNTGLAEWVSMGSPVYGLIFNDVCVNASGYNGVKESLPNEIEFGKEYLHTYSLQCKDIRSAKDNSILDFNIEDAYINFFVIDKTNRIVLNANKCKLGTTGVEKIESVESVVATTYYDLNGRAIANPANGIFIKVDKLADGKVNTSKVVVRK